MSQIYALALEEASKYDKYQIWPFVTLKVVVDLLDIKRMKGLCMCTLFIHRVDRLIGKTQLRNHQCSVCLFLFGPCDPHTIHVYVGCSVRPLHIVHYQGKIDVSQARVS